MPKANEHPKERLRTRPVVEPVRTPRQDALAAEVRAAAEAAIAALHAARADRQIVRDLEWHLPGADTVGDVDEIADALHGYASWVLSGAPHPRRADVLEKLRAAGQDLGFDVPSRLLKHSRRCRKLWQYVTRLQLLRETLAAYFEEEINAPAHPPPALRSAARSKS